jgi:ABC-2 type transport system ATP-binding protein
VIEVRGLTKHFGTTKAVDDLTFSVPPGIVTGFLGPNGAGKSTTMRLLLGLDRPSAGQALIGGRRHADSPAPLREVGALLDARDVHGGRTAHKHLLALAQSNALPAQRVDEVLDLVGLTSVAGKRIKGFSLGMSQRLGIAATLLGDPPVLLYDEPVNGLDPEGILWIRTFMRSMAAQGRTVLVSSHLMSEMAMTADHLVVIGRGRLLADTSVRDFIAQGASAAVRVVTPDGERLTGLLRASGFEVAEMDGALRVTGATAAQIGDLAAPQGIRLHELGQERASLEEAFMDMTRDSVDYTADARSPGAPVPRPPTQDTQHQQPERSSRP